MPCRGRSGDSVLELASSAGQSDLAQRLSTTVEATPVRSPRDRYLLLLTEYRQRGCVSGSPALADGSQPKPERQLLDVVDPGQLLCRPGQSQRGPGVLRQAGGFVARVSLAARCAAGLAYLELGNDRRAAAAFDEVIRLRPETMPAYYNRALAKYHLGDLPGRGRI